MIYLDFYRYLAGGEMRHGTWMEKGWMLLQHRLELCTSIWWSMYVHMTNAHFDLTVKYIDTYYLWERTQCSCWFYWFIHMHVHSFRLVGGAAFMFIPITLPLRAWASLPSHPEWDLRTLLMLQLLLLLLLLQRPPPVSWVCACSWVCWWIQAHSQTRRAALAMCWGHATWTWTSQRKRKRNWITNEPTHVRKGKRKHGQSQAWPLGEVTSRKQSIVARKIVCIRCHDLQCTETVGIHHSKATFSNVCCMVLCWCLRVLNNKTQKHSLLWWAPQLATHFLPSQPLISQLTNHFVNAPNPQRTNE